MTWVQPDKYYMECAGYRICRINLGPERMYELYKIGTEGRPSERIGYRKCTTDEEAKVAVEELKQIAGADGLYAGAGK